ncbi:PEP-CTERM sorting domain-containing protein [Massilia sp. UMI-21]|nr:PEP-CTERM sorting domain-containing protein [Massilia sp. UMI-21]
MRSMKTIFAIAAMSTAAAAQAAFIPSGIQTKVSTAQVANWGWTTCYEDAGSSNASIDSVKSACSGKYVMMASKTDADTFGILAAALREDVFFDTGNYNNVTHTANGAEWYFSTSWSMGFTALGNTVVRNSCDTNLAGWNGGSSTVGACWHTYNNTMSGGWGFNNGDGWQYITNRTLLMSNGPDGAVPEPGSFLLLGLGVLGLGAARRLRVSSKRI